MSTPNRSGVSGVVLVDKPRGITSHDVVSRVRRLLGTRKVGHAGTLDPMATGLLLLGVNSSTRLLTWIVGLDKEYLATIRLGAATTTDDAEGELLERFDVASISRAHIEQQVQEFTGKIRQRPSAVSAIKVDGKRAYALVREGQEVTLESRDVTVSAFDILEISHGEWLDIQVRVACSSGTYVRALARDLGEALGVGGHLTALRRTRIGPFSVRDAAALDETLPQHVRSPESVAQELFTSVQLDSKAARDLSNGKRIAIRAADGGPLAALAPEGRLIGLVQVEAGRARVLVNFPADTVPADTPEGAPSP